MRHWDDDRSRFDRDYGRGGFGPEDWRGVNREWERPNYYNREEPESRPSSSPNLRRGWGQEYDRDRYEYGRGPSFGPGNFGPSMDRGGYGSDYGNYPRDFDRERWNREHYRYDYGRREHGDFSPDYDRWSREREGYRRDVSDRDDFAEHERSWLSTNRAGPWDRGNSRGGGRW